MFILIVVSAIIGGFATGLLALLGIHGPNLMYSFAIISLACLAAEKHYADQFQEADET